MTINPAAAALLAIQPAGEGRSRSSSASFSSPPMENPAETQKKSPSKASQSSTALSCSVPSFSSCFVYYLRELFFAPAAAPLWRLEEKILSNAVKRGISIMAVMAALASLLHTAVTFLLMAMAFYRVPGVSSYSPTTVLCAFGCANTCVFSYVTLGQISSVAGTEQIPKWTWFNRIFLNLAGSSVFLIAFLFPGLSMFILLQKGESFESLFTSTALSGSIFRTLIAHIVFACLLFLSDSLSLSYLSWQLYKLQAPRRRQEELESQFLIMEERRARRNNIQAEIEIPEESEGLSLPEDFSFSPRIPVSGAARAFLAWKFSCSAAFEILLLIISIETKNSGPIIAFLLFLMFFPPLWEFLTFATARGAPKFFSEDFLTRCRLFVLLHFSLAYCFFWLSLGISLSIEVFDENYTTLLGNFTVFVRFLVVAAILLYCALVILISATLVLVSVTMKQLDGLREIKENQEEKRRRTVSIALQG